MERGSGAHGGEEDRRHLHRELQSAKRDRTRLTNRMKGLLGNHGLSVDLKKDVPVRNDQSFAHDNKVLNYNESLLIFGHVTSSIRFIEAIERGGTDNSTVAADYHDDIPF